MSKEILFCNKCRNYTLKTVCPKCGKKTISPKPVKYSPVDKFGKYRRIYKKSKTKSL